MKRQRVKRLKSEEIKKLRDEQRGKRERQKCKETKKGR